jgi:hypothetical protein
VGSILVAQIWPVGIHRIGSNIYFFFMAVNLICIPVSFLPITYTKPPPPTLHLGRHSDELSYHRSYTPSIPRPRGGRSKTWMSCLGRSRR